MSGNIQLMFESVSQALPLMRAGALRGIGVSSTERNADLPDLPTIAESGYPDFRISVWNGVAVPAAVPDDIAQKLTDSLNRALADDMFRASLAKLGYGAFRPPRPRRDRGVHRRRTRAMVEPDQDPEHLSGITHGSRK